MRKLSASVVLSSIILGGWLTGAKAQDVGFETPSVLNAVPNDQAAADDESRPGVIPQPTVDSPGVVTGISLGELYTDNLKLAGPGEPKESSWITQIQPFLKSAYSSPRFSGVFNYMLTGYLYPGESSHNQLAQDLDANGTLTILPQHFFLDGIASYRRQIINNRRPSGGGTFFLNNNQANVGIASLSPYWVQDLGNAGIMSLRYSLGRVVYNDRGIPGQGGNQLGGIPNVTSSAAQFSLVSPKYETWGWSLGYSEQRLDPDFGQSVQFAMAKVGISRQISNGTRVFADAGKETRFLPNGTLDKLGASFWDAGIDWSNTRDHFRVMAGHRFFGPSYQLSWTHVAARLTTNLSYVEQPTDYNQQLLGLNAGSGAPRPINVRPSIPSLTERNPYLSKRWSASATYLMPRGTLRARLYDESRTYFFDDNVREKVANADVSWLYNLGPFTTLTPTVGWQRYEFRDGQTNYTHFVQLALVHQLNAKNFGSVKLRNRSRNVSFGAPEEQRYRVNVIFVQWTHLF